MGRELRLMVDGWQGVDANHGTEGRQGQRYIAHVRRATAALLGLAQIRKHPAKRLGVPAVESCYIGIMTHLCIRWTAPHDFELGSCGEGSSLKTAHNFGADLVEVVQRLRTHHVTRRSLRRDNVR